MNALSRSSNTRYFPRDRASSARSYRTNDLLPAAEGNSNQHTLMCKCVTVMMCWINRVLKTGARAPHRPAKACKSLQSGGTSFDQTSNGRGDLCTIRTRLTLYLTLQRAPSCALSCALKHRMLQPAMIRLKSHAIDRAHSPESGVRKVVRVQSSGLAQGHTQLTLREGAM